MDGIKIEFEKTRKRHEDLGRETRDRIGGLRDALRAANTREARVLVAALQTGWRDHASQVSG